MAADEKHIRVSSVIYCGVVCEAEKTKYPRKKDVITYLIELMALVRARFMTPDTFEDIALHIVDVVPIGCKRVDLIAETYRECFIKDPERLERGCAERILGKSPSSHLSRNFEEFLKNGENKKRMIEIFKDVYISQWRHVLSKLECEIF